MYEHWNGDFTVPNAGVYPWQWLWDSCFHAVIWLALGRSDRAVVELRSALSEQRPQGFVPHLRYVGENPHARFWGLARTSSITQPPMYGHALAELVRAGVEVPDELVRRATAGLRFLLASRRRSAEGLVRACHPWESGCDDSPRWDDWCGGTFDHRRWYDVKGELLAAIERSAGGAPLDNPAFAVAPAGFNALIAWNALELATVTGDDALAAAGRELAAALSTRWDADLRTWVDAGPSAEGSGRIRTLDALLPALVCADHAADAFDELADATAYGTPFGPAGVHVAEPVFERRAYWRGPAWPQLSYLLWVAASRSARHDLASSIGSTTAAAVSSSGLAEYWDPLDGTGLGAIPQSWSGLALVMAEPASTS
jgi:hypothetical protein